MSAAPTPPSAHPRRAFERFANAAWKACGLHRTQLAETGPLADLLTAVQLAGFALPPAHGPVTALTAAEVRARCAAVAAHAFRLAEAVAARVPPEDAPPRTKEDCFQGDAP